MSTPLEIAFFGSSLLSADWNGAATYYRGVISTLAKRGHRTTFYARDAFDRQAHRDIDEPPWPAEGPADLGHGDRSGDLRPSGTTAGSVQRADSGVEGGGHRSRGSRLLVLRIRLAPQS